VIIVDKCRGIACMEQGILKKYQNFLANTIFNLFISLEKGVDEWR